MFKTETKLGLSIFQNARLKLTVGYLFIIMLVSLSFSGLIYRGVTKEIERRLEAIEVRLELPGRGPGPSPGQAIYFIQDLEIARRRILIILLYVNGAIFVVSATVAYYLAGKTLQPIEEALEEQKRFVADASHELRTPLAALKTSIEVALRNKKLTKAKAIGELKDSLKDINDLEFLTTDLLSLTLYQKANGIQTKKPVDVRDVVNGAKKKLAPMARKKRVVVKTKIEDVVVMANEESLTKLLTILLDNAIKYTPSKGKVKVKAERKKKELVFTVSDDGIGISKSDLPHIFDRFYRADTSRNKVKVAGFGLGLSMAKQIVNLHGGSVEVESEVGKGTSFKVSLPL